MLILNLKFWIPLNSGLRVRQSLHSSYQLDSSQTVAVAQFSFALPLFSCLPLHKSIKTATSAATEAFECLLGTECAYSIGFILEGHSYETINEFLWLHNLI